MTAVEGRVDGFGVSELLTFNPPLATGSALGNQQQLPLADFRVDPADSRLTPEVAAHAAEAIARVAADEDAWMVRQWLRGRRLRFDPRELLLALCSRGRTSDFEFVLDCFRTADHELVINQSAAVIEAAAGLAARGHLPRLREIMEQEWFRWTWSDRDDERDGGDESAGMEDIEHEADDDNDWVSHDDNGVAVRDSRNRHLVRRLVGAAFAQVAQHSEIDELIELLSHRYWTVWHGAAQAVGRVGSERDLDVLVESAIRSGAKSPALAEAIDFLDRKLYGPGAA